MEKEIQGLWISEELCQSRAIPLSEKFLLAFITFNSDSNGFCNISNKEIAAFLDCHPSTVSVLLKRLVNKGLIEATLFKARSRLIKVVGGK